MSSPTREERPLLCVLTAEEFEQRVAEYTTIDKKIETTEEEARASAKEFRDHVRAFLSDKIKLREAIETHRERRVVECEWRRVDGPEKRMQLVRLDTGEVVDTRGATSLELQSPLDLRN
jgi:hypothetical protein